MASRNLTAKFELFRNQHRNNKRAATLAFPSSSSSSSYSRRNLESGDHPLLADEDPQSSSSDIPLSHLHPSLPPDWLSIVDTIQRDSNKIRELLGSLNQLHSTRLKVQFGDDEVNQQERDIELLTHKLTQLFHSCENQVKRIASVGNDGHLSAQDRTVRLNVMRSLAADLQQLSKTFRSSQKEFLRQLRDQEDLGESLGFIGGKDDSKSSISFEEALDRGLSVEQLQQMQQIEREASEREVEIIRIAQSINELSTIFKELNVLVIEQGSILDRIDYNIEQTVIKVKTGNKELKSADDYSKKALTIKCILLLAFICAVLLGILIWKHSVI